MRRRRKRKGPTSWQRRRRRLLLCFGIPFTLLAVWFYWRLGIRREIEVQWAAFEAAGFPTTLEDLLEPYPAVGEGEAEGFDLNEALAKTVSAQEFNLAWRAAQENPYAASVVDEELRRNHALKSIRSHHQDDPWDEENAKIVVEFLRANADAMSAVLQALERPAYRYTLDLFTNTNYYQFQHWGSLTRVSRLFAMRTIVQLYEDDVEGATASVNTLFRLGEILRDETLYTAQATRRRCDSVAYERLKDLLNHAQLEDQALQRLQEAASRVACVECWTKALAGNAVVSIEEYRNQTNNVLVLTAMLIGFHDRDVAHFLKKIRDFDEIAQLPWRLQTEEQRRFGVQANSFGPWQQLSSPLSTFYINSYFGVADVMAVEQARSDMAMLALAIERYRLAIERLPETLDELVPRFIDELPLDPYTGLPYAYDRLSPGYAINTMPTQRGAIITGKGITFSVAR